jgi:hypothetical protein
MTPPELRDLLGDDVPDDERKRLERVHELLVQAGPPPELTPELEQPLVPAADGAEVVPFLPRPRRGFSIAVAATVGLLAFFGGVLWGQHQNSFDVTRTVAMHGVGDGRAALASIEIGNQDSAGNWPMLVHVRGLSPLPKSQYYELFLARKGRPIASCGTFNVRPGDKTDFRINVAYRLKRFDGWIVTRVRDPQGDHRKEIVMTT